MKSEPGTPVRPKEPGELIVTPKIDPPAVVDVRFAITSEPSGATVLRNGIKAGVTPLDLTVQRKDGAPAQLELSFVLEGYEPASVVAQGLDGTVSVTRALTKKVVVTDPPPHTNVKRPKNPRPPKNDGKNDPKNPDGYKDDPY